MRLIFKRQSAREANTPQLLRLAVNLADCENSTSSLDSGIISFCNPEQVQHQHPARDQKQKRHSSSTAHLSSFNQTSASASASAAGACASSTHSNYSLAAAKKCVKMERASISDFSNMCITKTHQLDTFGCYKLPQSTSSDNLGKYLSSLSHVHGKVYIASYSMRLNCYELFCAIVCLVLVLLDRYMLYVLRLYMSLLSVSMYTVQ